MALITWEQREAEIASRQAFEVEVAQREAERKRQLAAMLSIKQRLMRRLEHNVIITMLQDDLGDFPVTTRFMSNAEIDVAKKFEELASGDPTGEGYFKAMKGFRELLDDITITPELQGGFWSASDCPADPAAVMAIVLRTMRETITAIGAASSFRNNR